MSGISKPDPINPKAQEEEQTGSLDQSKLPKSSPFEDIEDKNYHQPTTQEPVKGNKYDYEGDPGDWMEDGFYFEADDVGADVEVQPIKEPDFTIEKSIQDILSSGVERDDLLEVLSKVLQKTLPDGTIEMILGRVSEELKTRRIS